MKHVKLLFGILAILVIAMLATGCGGSSGTADTQDGTGEVAVSLTDAPGDFANYTVDVKSLTLTRANGAQVSVLPLQARIDFSQYTDMTEFLTAMTVPSGVYVSATMTLDYSNADIWVEGESGAPVQAAAVLDSDGNPAATMEVTVQLEDRSRLRIVPGVPAHLLLDFNLQTTNQVRFDNGGAATVTVDPFLVAELHRLRGLLNDVSLDESSFTIYLRPFYCALSGSQAPFGLRTVVTTDSTLFNIDGDQYEGLEGLTVMTGLDPLTAVVAIGDLMFNPLRFEAREVYAGSSVPGGDLDAVEGSVVSRQGDSLTIKGVPSLRISVAPLIVRESP